MAVSFSSARGASGEEAGIGSEEMGEDTGEVLSYPVPGSLSGTGGEFFAPYH